MIIFENKNYKTPNFYYVLLIKQLIALTIGYIIFYINNDKNVGFMTLTFVLMAIFVTIYTFSYNYLNWIKIDNEKKEITINYIQPFKAKEVRVKINEIKVELFNFGFWISKFPGIRFYFLKENKILKILPLESEEIHNQIKMIYNHIANLQEKEPYPIKNKRKKKNLKRPDLKVN